MNRTITPVFVDQISLPSVSMVPEVGFNFSQEGAMPGVLVEYEDGSKLLTIVTGSNRFSFRDKSVYFDIEDYFYNIQLKRWDRTNSGTYRPGIGMTILNENLVESTNGRDKASYYIEVDDLEKPILDAAGNVTGQYKKKQVLADPNDIPNSFIGEYDYWMKVLGRTILIPPMQSEIMNNVTKQLETIEAGLA